jgi:hypothetical protein
MRLDSRMKTAALSLLIATAVPAWGADPPRSLPSKLRLETHELAARAVQLPVGGKFDLLGVEKDGQTEPATLELERYEVFASDATVTVHGLTGDRVQPPPPVRYFRGKVAGDPTSRIFLAVPMNGGDVHGLITGRGGAWVVEPSLSRHKSGAPGVKMSTVQGLTSLKNDFSCGSDLLPPPEADFLVSSPAPHQVPPMQSATAGVVSFTARIAVETDFEFFQNFGSVTEATNYVAALIGFISTVYEDEISTSLVVSSLSLWTTSADPYTQTSTLCSLFEFGRHWNNNNGGVSRTIAHFLSGKGTGGGVAWLGVLCGGAFNVNASCPGLPSSANYGGAYGYTGNIFGSFNPASPNLVWDVYGVAHEIGHNFNSPHTHCYGGLGGNANPIDSCNTGECGNSGCACGSNTLPGPAGAGSGTIMSYCHLLSGGFSNLSFTFGAGHPFGVAPERVGSRMSSHVTTRASSNPSCLAFVSPALLNDGFEAGNTSAWTTN